MAVSSLASSQASDITGQTINVDGGYVMHIGSLSVVKQRSTQKPSAISAVLPYIHEHRNVL